MNVAESYTELDVDVLPPAPDVRQATPSSPRDWYSLGADPEYERGLRFCDLYRADRRTRREEAELSAIYQWAYTVAFETVARIARKAGFFDQDILADCATGLVDFCARQYDAATVAKASRVKTYPEYLKNIAYAYLRKHRDFLTFSRRMTDTGFASGDLLTNALVGDPGNRLERLVARERDQHDTLDTLHPDALEPLYASDRSSGYTDDPADGGPDAGLRSAASDDDSPLTLSGWVDRAVQHIQDNHLSPEILAARAPAILDQLRMATGARITDIAKRLVVRVKSGCRIALSLLQALRGTLTPERHERTIQMIDAALLAQVQEYPADDVDVAETPYATALPDIPDLGLLIDTGDLRHGRTPPPKPRYVTVDHPPVDPAGTPPPLDDDAPPGVSETGTAEIVFIGLANARLNMGPRQVRGVVRYPTPPPGQRGRIGLAALWS